MAERSKEKEMKRGDKVEVNGNKEARLLDEYSAGMWNVRLWQGLRLVGDVCVPISDIKPVSTEMLR